jgi:hypothetical protein
MELNMLDLTKGKKIFSNLYNTLVITVDCSGYLNRKAKFSQKFVNLNYFSTCLNNAMIFFFCSRKPDYLLFISQPHQWSSAIVKHIAKSGLLIINFSSLVGFGEDDQRI